MQNNRAWRWRWSVVSLVISSALVIATHIFLLSLLTLIAVLSLVARLVLSLLNRMRTFIERVLERI